LLFHHLVEVLLLKVKLLHDPAEALLEPVDFLVELLADFQLKLIVVLFFGGWGLRLHGLDLSDKFLYHLLHAEDHGRAAHNVVLLARVLEDAL